MKPWSDKQLRTFFNVFGLGGQLVGGVLTLAALFRSVVLSDTHLGMLLGGVILFVFGQAWALGAWNQLQINELKRRLEALEAGRPSEKPT